VHGLLLHPDGNEFEQQLRPGTHTLLVHNYKRELLREQFQIPAGGILTYRLSGEPTDVRIHSEEEQPTRPSRSAFAVLSSFEIWKDCRQSGLPNSAIRRLIKSLLRPSLVAGDASAFRIYRSRDLFSKRFFGIMGAAGAAVRISRDACMTLRGN
jgi:hypothetical protein